MRQRLKFTKLGVPKDEKIVEKAKSIKIEIPKSELFRIYKSKSKYNHFYFRFKSWFKDKYIVSATGYKEAIHDVYCVENKGHDGCSITEKEIFFFCKYMDLFPEINHQDVCFHLAGYKNKKEIKRDERKERIKNAREDYNDITKDFYSTDRWKFISNKVKNLYGRVCMKCGQDKGSMHADHILPRSLYPSFEFDIKNIQVLCKKCNLDKGNSNQIDYRTQEHMRICNKYLD
jgi:5-methylcytosine-specific restriction endonuclease McrA